MNLGLIGVCKKKNPSVVFSGEKKISTLGSIVPRFPLERMGPRVEIFLSPLTTHDGFYLSTTLLLETNATLLRNVHTLSLSWDWLDIYLVLQFTHFLSPQLNFVLRPVFNLVRNFETNFQFLRGISRCVLY